MAKRGLSSRGIQGRSRKSALGRGERDAREKRSDGDYDVGFGKPPKGSQFKPGVSGNPKGRPKWKNDGMLTDLVGKELYRAMRINQNGERISMPALQVALRRLSRMAAEGNPKAVENMLKIARDHSQTVAVEEKVKFSSMPDEERAQRLRQLFERVERRQRKKEASAQKEEEQRKIKK